MDHDFPRCGHYYQHVWRKYVRSTLGPDNHADHFAEAYGEAEFIFASIKVLTITGLIILGIVLDLGGGPNHDRLGFRYWKHPGPFAQFNGIGGSKGRFLAFWDVLTQAAFSFIGTEIVAIAAGEAKNPRRNIPKAYVQVVVAIAIEL